MIHDASEQINALKEKNEESIEYGRSRAWQILQKYSLRFASQEKIEQVKEIWCEVAAECEKKFKTHQRKLKALTK